MSHGPYFADIAHLLGDPARANMLHALMDGRALTAKELAYMAGVAPQTASGHLAKLREGGLLSQSVQGRHRYFRIAGPDVAAILEGLMVLSRSTGLRRLPPRISADMAKARTCYDHFAGSFGTALHDALLDGGHVAVDTGGYRLTASGEDIFVDLGIETLQKGRRAPLRPCLDWSERRPHLAGSLAGALACRCFEAGWVRRRKDSRAVDVTEEGWRTLREALPGLRCEALDEPVRAAATARVTEPA